MSDLTQLRNDFPSLYTRFMRGDSKVQIEEAPVEEAPVEEAPVEEAPVEEAQKKKPRAPRKPKNETKPVVEKKPRAPRKPKE